MEIVGKIIVIGATETIGAKEFKKRLLVLKTEENYPQTIPVEFTQDKTTVLNNYSIGDLVKVGINLRGSEWQGKYYANIQGWKIEKTVSTDLTAQKQMPDREPVFGTEESDLPF